MFPGVHLYDLNDQCSSGHTRTDLRDLSQLAVTRSCISGIQEISLMGASWTPTVVAWAPACMRGHILTCLSHPALNTVVPSSFPGRAQHLASNKLNFNSGTRGPQGKVDILAKKREKRKKAYKTQGCSVVGLLMLVAPAKTGKWGLRERSRCLRKEREG